MAFVDTGSLKVIERLPGWFGRYFHTENMTFARNLAGSAGGLCRWPGC